MIEVALALVLNAGVLEPSAVLTLPPHVGVVFGEKEPVAVAVFLPWVLRIPSEEGAPFRPNQVMIEPGVVFRAVTSFTARVALRWLRSPVPWLGLGGGAGMGFELGELARAVSSIEWVVRLGPGPTGFGLLTARVELRSDGSTAWLLAAGATYW